MTIQSGQNNVVKEFMKKIVLLCAVYVFSFCGALLAQTSITRTEKEKFKENLEAILSKAESSAMSPVKLNGILQTLDDNEYLNPLYLSDLETKREVSRRLIKIFSVIGEAPLDGESKGRILSILSFVDTPEVHELFLSVLENGPGTRRKQVLRGLSFGGVKGDDVYAKVKNLLERGLAKSEEGYPALKGADKQRALKDIQDFIKATKNPEEYVWGGILLCDFKRPDALDVIVERYDYFKSIPLAEKPSHYDPSLSFDIKMLKEYIKVMDGERLRKALEIFGDSGVFGDSKMELLRDKSRSPNAISRKAVVGFLSHQVEVGSVSKDQVLPIFTEMRTRETNPAVKLKLKTAIETIGHPAGFERKH